MMMANNQYPNPVIAPMTTDAKSAIISSDLPGTERNLIRPKPTITTAIFEIAEVVSLVIIILKNTNAILTITGIKHNVIKKPLLDFSFSENIKELIKPHTNVIQILDNCFYKQHHI